jgi:hypothetical protein
MRKFMGPVLCLILLSGVTEEKIHPIDVASRVSAKKCNPPAKEPTVFRLRTENASCRTGRRVAKKFMKKCFWNGSCEEGKWIDLRNPPFECRFKTVQVDPGAYARVRCRDSGDGRVRFKAGS